MATRDDILNKLRATLHRPNLRFPPREPQSLSAETRMAVTSAEGPPAALARRFGVELEALHGSYEIADTPAEARLALISRLQAWAFQEESARKGPRRETGQERSILSWHPDSLPLSGLAPVLADLDFTLVTPERLRTSEEREKVRFIRFGLTGVEAACASTGSLIVLASPQTNRAASLLPLRHIALAPFSRLYPTLEAWLADQRDTGRLVTLLGKGSTFTMITGPSKSADIEMNLTLGVHGPKFVHVILFNDLTQQIQDSD